MKVTNLHQTNCFVDRTDACRVALITDESRYMKNDFVVSHGNGFQKRIAANVLRIPQLSYCLRSGYVVSQEPCKSRQGNNDCCQVENVVPLSCDMVTESERSSSRTEAYENNVPAYTSTRLAHDKCRQLPESPSIACRCSADKCQVPVIGNQQFNSGVSLSSGSTLSSASVRSASVRCKWNKCGCEIASDMLLEHIRIKHVDTQVQLSDDNKVKAEEQSFVCLWSGCKVYNRPSCLLTWLERHIVSHLGDKPYCCIVAGCGARFASQVMLERHVNGHFSGTCSASLAVSRLLRKGDSVIKLTRKRKSRSVRPYPVLSQDFFDSRIMEAIQKQLTVFSTGCQIKYEVSGNDVTFQHAVVAKRADSCGQTEVLIQWTPPDVSVVPEAWLLECDFSSVRYKTLPLSSLPDSFGKPVKHSARK